MNGPMRTFQRGYARVYMPQHPRAIDGRVWEHVVVAESALGHRLPEGAVVHHVNKNKADNRPANLVICESSAYHSYLHSRLRICERGGDPSVDKICTQCKYLKPRTDFGVERRAYDCLNSRCRMCVMVCDIKKRRARGMKPQHSNADKIATLLPLTSVRNIRELYT